MSRPKLISAPTLLPYSSTPELNGLMCYVIRHYGHDGFAVLITRTANKDGHILTGDWFGNIIDPTATPLARAFISEYASKLIEIMTLINLRTVQFNMSTDRDIVRLVDLMINPWSFCGPGMIRDLFSKIIPIAEIITIKQIDESIRLAIDTQQPPYQGNLIIKPSKFRTVERNNGTSPLYVEVLR